jgi:hypothetical protein
MIGSGADALEHALELHARPGALATLRQRPLPDAVLLLIRIAAGDRQAIQDAAIRTSVGTRALTDAAVMYLRQVLFDADADNYRLLGVRADAGEDAFKEHYRWLMRWLHPDRDPDRLGEADAQRVNRAWHVLRSSERRLAYDRQRARQAAPPTQSASVPLARCREPVTRVPPRPLLSPRTVHYLPVIVLGGLALLAGGSLASWRWLDEIGETNVAALRSHRNDTHVVAHVAVAQALMSPPLQAVATAPIAPQEPSHAETGHTAMTPAARTASGHQAVPAHGAQSTSVDASDKPATPQHVERIAATVALPDTARGSAVGVTADHTEADPNQVDTNHADPDRPYAMVPDRLANAYAQGDLVQMMRLFAPDAIDDRGGIATIANEYDRLFRMTRSRRLRLGPLTWRTQDERIVGTGAFDARMRRRGHAYARHLHGRILLEVAPVDDQWKIERISLREGQ